MKILTICPSIRKDHLFKMLRSFNQTKFYSDIIVTDEVGYTTDLINAIFKDNYNYDYYHITNDDFIYHTNGWDQILANTIKNKKGYGIAYGDDMTSKGVPTVPFISGNVARSVGWLQLPGLRYLYGDRVWGHLGAKINSLYYVPKVKIEHRHFMNRKVEKDNVYEKTNSDETYKHDEGVFRKWVKGKAKEDIRKIQMGVPRLRDACGIQRGQDCLL